jgi:phenylacetate-coenzyme A ligase PaaK-like adenylate-forming protein
LRSADLFPEEFISAGGRHRTARSLNALQTFKQQKGEGWMAPTAAHELREIETTDPEAIQNLQLEKLRSQLDYVLKNSAFYQTKFAAVGFQPGDIKTLNDVSGLPFTTKEDIRSSQADHPPLGNHVAASMESIIRIHSSSGTKTGKYGRKLRRVHCIPRGLDRMILLSMPSG